jgi:hypothetical protein
MPEDEASGVGHPGLRRVGPDLNLNARAGHQGEPLMAANSATVNSPAPTCSICGRAYSGSGHSAWPIGNGRCCDSCAKGTVTPAKLELLVRWKVLFPPVELVRGPR